MQTGVDYSILEICVENMWFRQAPGFGDGRAHNCCMLKFGRVFESFLRHSYPKTYPSYPTQLFNIYPSSRSFAMASTVRDPIQSTAATGPPPAAQGEAPVGKKAKKEKLAKGESQSHLEVCSYISSLADILLPDSNTFSLALHQTSLTIASGSLRRPRQSMMNS